MADASPRSANSVVCPGCGSPQNKTRKECSRCGHPLQSPAQIYRREADGTWTPVGDIDLSMLAPKPPPARKKLNRRKAAVVASLVVAGALLNIWLWRMRVRAARLEVDEKISYVKNPIGRIVPHFEARYLRTPVGELTIAGQTNLPEGTLLDVQVYAGELLVAVDYPVDVRGGAFQTRSLLERGKPFTPGPYQVRIRAAFGKRWQPPAVLAVVGPSGERLDGPQIHRTDATSEAKLEFAEDFALHQ